MQKIRLAMITDLLDRKPERTPYYRRLITELLKDPSFELTLIHYEPNPDQPLYKQAREIILPRIQLPVATRFVSFMRFCLTTKERFDIVHWFMPRVYPFFWLFPAKKKVIMTHGGGDILSPTDIWSWSRTIYNYTLIWFSKYVDAMIGVTGYANREIMYAYGVPPEKVFTIIPSLDQMYDPPPSDEHVHSVLKKHNLKKGTYILYMGRFRLHKNVGNLVHAYIKYREANPHTNEHLVLAGSKKDEYLRSFGEIPESPYSSDIRFVGYIETEDMPSIYCGATALAFVTLSEGFGMPILEAWACKVPVITSNVTAMPEVAGNAAIIIDPHDPEVYAEALALVHKPEVRNTLIERGIKRCRFFTMEMSTAGWVAVYKKVLFGQKKIQYDERPPMPEVLPYEMH
jgi:glycosyltransferase involved in cell wall biosynthesis